MYNKTNLLDLVFCDIQNNPGLGKGHQPEQVNQLRLITLTLTLIILDITKTSSNNKLLFITAHSTSQGY